MWKELVKKERTKSFIASHHEGTAHRSPSRTLTSRRDSKQTQIPGLASFSRGYLRPNGLV
jgi:hypothetical protein